MTREELQAIRSRARTERDRLRYSDQQATRALITLVLALHERLDSYEFSGSLR